MRAIRVLGASGFSSRFGGLRLVSAGLCRAMCFAPPAVVVVPPEHFFQDGIDDVVGIALDKPCVVFQEFIVTGSSNLISLVVISGAFLMIGMLFLLW
jgi:hypothetical protein